MSRKLGNKGAIPPGYQRAKIRCINGCRGPRGERVQTWPIGESAPPTLCCRCLKTGGKEPAMLTGRHKPKAIDPDEWRGNPVKIYCPGDPGFETVSAQCTHVSKIKNTAFQRSMSADIDAKDRQLARRRRKEKDTTDSINFSCEETS